MSIALNLCHLIRELNKEREIRRRAAVPAGKGFTVGLYYLILLLTVIFDSIIDSNI